MAASGAVALFHVRGVTPEAEDVRVLEGELQNVRIDSLKDGYLALSSQADTIDFVSIGCPHASLEQIADIARELEGKHVRTALWVTTARAIRDAAERAGHVAVIEAAGGRVVSDTCLVVAPVETFGWRTMATNSAKAAFYAPSQSHLQVRLGTAEQCIEATLVGRWPQSHTE
jgi:predicted aconitase